MLMVHVSTRFKRSFRRIPKAVQEDFAKQIEQFQVEPFHSDLRTHKLSGGLAGRYSFYLRDGYRVLFEFLSDNVVLLVNIGSHDQYRKWSK